ncbi:MAG: hypothetical protein RLZZ214_3199 [Verrucomicrobiota bacterium]
MKIITRQSLPMFALGLMLGAGIVQSGWLLRDPPQPELAQPDFPSTATRNSRSSSPKSSSRTHSRGNDSLEEKARLLAAVAPSKAWRQSLDMTNFPDRLAYVTGLMREWGRKDPVTALKMAADLPAGILKQDATGAACAGWASLQPEAAASWATTHLSGPLAGEAFSFIAEEWVANSPTAAAEWVATLPQGALAEGATNAVIEAWAESDPQGATKWIDSLRDPERRIAALATLAADWCAQSPEEAAKWVATRLKNPEGGDLVEALISEWGAQDPRAASRWLMTLPGDVQSSATVPLISRWADSDPQAAAGWVRQLPEGDPRREGIPALASSWANSEPEKAIAWVLTLPDSPEQAEALDDAVRTWTSIAPAALSAWLEQQAPGEASDEIRTVAAGMLLESRPQDALAMAAGISNPVQRDASLGEFLSRWGKKDSAAARKWVAAAGLPPAVSQRAGPPSSSR